MAPRSRHARGRRRPDALPLANLKAAFVEQKLVGTPPDMAKLYTEAFLPKR